MVTGGLGGWGKALPRIARIVGHKCCLEEWGGEGFVFPTTLPPHRVLEGQQKGREKKRVRGQRCTREESGERQNPVRCVQESGAGVSLLGPVQVFPVCVNILMSV